MKSTRISNGRRALCRSVTNWMRDVALRGSAATWRVRQHGLDELDRRLAAGELLIVVFWHAKYVTLLPLLRGRDAVVFTSRSARGDAIADLLRRYGFTPVQLEDCGGDASLALMRRALSCGRSCAIAVDGPLGPRHLVHRGAVQLAAALGHKIVPVALVIHPKRVIEKRWDKLELPRLFSRVQVEVGEPISIPATADTDAEPEGLTFWSQRVHDELERLEADAERRYRHEHPDRSAVS